MGAFWNKNRPRKTEIFDQKLKFRIWSDVREAPGNLLKKYLFRY